MGGNVSSLIQEKTVVAYTLYGSGCKRCCSNDCEFYLGAPKEGCCGVASYTTNFSSQAPLAAMEVLQDFERDLMQPAQIASEHVTYCSHILMGQCDSTAERAARAIEEDWCPAWNERFQEENLVCQVRAEVFGFGRSRATFLVIRVLNPNSGRNGDAKM
eukprot:jgi/Bigna1/143286/aug1.77_g17994